MKDGKAGVLQPRLLSETSTPLSARRGLALGVGLFVRVAICGGLALLVFAGGSTPPPGLVALKNAAAIVFVLACASLVVTSLPRAASRPLPAVAAGARHLALLAGIVLCAQMGHGVLVRYQAAMASASWCAGQAGCAAAGLSIDGAALLTGHRLGSITAIAMVLLAAMAMFRATLQRPWLRGLSVVTGLLVVVQALLGVANVRALLGLGGAGDGAHSHIGAGAALLLAQWGLVLASADSAALPPARAAWSIPAVRGTLRDLVALAKPRLSLLVIITFAGGLWLSPASTLSAVRAWLALVGTVLVVAAANAFNMVIERDIDRYMTRTKTRPLPTGRLSPEVALAFGAICLCVGLPMVAFASNGLCALLGFIAFASYVFVYTPLKQRSQAALFVGALPGALPPLMGTVAATGVIDTAGLALFGVLFAWQIPHFLAIAMMRSDEYAAAGFKIMPVQSGLRVTRACALGFAILTVGLSLLLPILAVTGVVYAVAAVALGAMFIRACAAPPRRLFGISIVYLMLLFVAIGVDRLAAALLG